jgi:hypothetical protein
MVAKLEEDLGRSRPGALHEYHYKVAIKCCHEDG